MFCSPSSASLSIEVLHGFSAGNNSPRMSYVPTSNPFKPRPPMSDENKTNNPFQPPTQSDQPLARKGKEDGERELHPVHFASPLAGYACFPLFVGLAFTGPYVHALVWLPLQAFSYLILLIVPFYAGFNLWLTYQSIKARKHSVGLTLFQILSIAPPLLLSLRGLSIMPEVW